MKQQRDTQDLFEIITRLSRRIEALEKSPRLSSASIDNGQLTITGGDIVVKAPDGTEVLVISGGSQPTITMQPDGGTDYKLEQLGWESIGSGAAYQVTVRRAVDDVHDGGKLLLMRGASYLAHQPDGGPESFYSAGTYFDGNLFMKGKFGNNLMDADGEAATICGSVAVSAGVSSYSHTYGAPSDGTMVAVVQMVNTAGALGGCLTAMSNSGFTFAWTGTLAKTINYWCFRI